VVRSFLVFLLTIVLKLFGFRYNGMVAITVYTVSTVSCIQKKKDSNPVPFTVASRLLPHRLILFSLVLVGAWLLIPFVSCWIFSFLNSFFLLIFFCHCFLILRNASRSSSSFSFSSNLFMAVQFFKDFMETSYSFAILS